VRGDDVAPFLVDRGVVVFGSCFKVNEWLTGYDRPWGIAGGWAIDLFVGRKLREHSDIEIAMYREDQHELKNMMSDWSFNKVVNRELYPWKDEFLKLPIHEIHIVHKQSVHHLEVLLNERSDGKWIFRRDPRITFPETSLFLSSKEGIAYLHPAIVLLYKAKNTREIDHADFHSVKELLEVDNRKWLRAALQIHVPEHPWINSL
jgi:hypothetical protein